SFGKSNDKALDMGSSRKNSLLSKSDASFQCSGFIKRKLSDDSNGEEPTLLPL
ncbi:unnamed protein product, partial [Rotaria magnacalcarata]